LSRKKCQTANFFLQKSIKKSLWLARQSAILSPAKATNQPIKKMTKDQAKQVASEAIVNAILQNADGINPIGQHDFDHWVNEFADRIKITDELTVQVENEIENVVHALLAELGMF
jgi:hypothetical protein